MNGRLLCATDADGSPRISRKQSRAPRRGSSLPAFACFLGVWQGPETMAINIESDFEEDPERYMGTPKILRAPLLARNQTMRARSEHLRQLAHQYAIKAAAAKN